MTYVVADEAAERQAFSYPLARDSQITRVAVIGESSGAMLGWEMRSIVDASHGSDRVQLLGCAQPGAGLEHLERQAEEVLAYDPDVLVVVFGHNVDFCYPTDRAHLQRLRWRSRSRLLSELGARAAAGGDDALESLGQRLERFARWLDELADRAAQHDVTLIVTTVTSNLWMPPRSSVEAINDPRLIAARFEYAAGRRDDAIERVLNLAVDSNEPAWHFTVGVWLSRAGRHDQAREHLQLALDTERTAPGGYAPLGRDRAWSAVNERIRATAAREDVVLRDTARVMEASAFARAPGWDIMEDHCHLQLRATRSEANAVLRLALAAPGNAPAIGSEADTDLDPPTAAELASVLGLLTTTRRSDSDFRVAIALALERWLALYPSAARAAVEQYLASGEFESAGEHGRRGELLAALADGYWHAGDRAEARRLNDLARAYPVAAPWIQLGRFELSDGNQAGARDALVRADAIDAGLADVAYFLERLERLDGSPERPGGK